MPTKANITREKILRNVSKALGRELVGEGDYQESLMANLAEITGEQSDLEALYATLIANPPSQNYVGVSEDMPPQARMQTFIERAQAVAAVVTPLKSSVEFPEYLLRLVGDQNAAIYKGLTPTLEHMDWSSAPKIHFTSDYTLPGQWGLLEAKCAIAETGSVVVWSSETHSTAAGFLVDKLIVCVRTSNMVLGLEDIWPVIDRDGAMAALRAENKSDAGYTPYPRAINIITGPSRTADVEQKVQLGAHGPRELYIAVIDE